MQITGTVKTLLEIGDNSTYTTVIENAEITDVKIIEERECPECLQTFENDDPVIVIATSRYKKGRRLTPSISLDKPYVIHLKNKDGKVCVEDFMLRLLESLNPKEESSKEEEQKISQSPEDLESGQDNA